MAFLKRRNSIKAIFEVEIDFVDKKKYGELEKGKSYYLPLFSNQEKQIGYDEIKSYVIDIIETDLKKHLEKAVGCKLKIFV